LRQRHFQQKCRDCPAGVVRTTAARQRQNEFTKNGMSNKPIENIPQKYFCCCKTRDSQISGCSTGVGQLFDVQRKCLCRNDSWAVNFVRFVLK
jgi:hypothetical protein